MFVSYRFFDWTANLCLCNPGILHNCNINYAGVFISLKLLRGPLVRVKEENPLLFRKFTAECQKLGFPEIIRPCELWQCKLIGY